MDEQQLFSDVAVIKSVLSANTKKLDRYVEETIKINDRCLLHLSNYKEFSEHIAESKQKKRIWDDRGFQILMFISTCIWGLMFFYVQHLYGQTNGRNHRVITENTR